MRCKVELSYKILMRYFWISLGCISFILGTIGIILPLLPTVPFYLLTLYCFLKVHRDYINGLSKLIYIKTFGRFCAKANNEYKGKIQSVFYGNSNNEHRLLFYAS